MSQQSLFDKFAAGDDASLLKLLDAERDALFDYMVRMTGDVVRSRETLEEVAEAFIGQARHYPTYPAFRFTLYQTARSFNADAWNGDTSRLENEGLSGRGPGEDCEADVAVADLVDLELEFRALAGSFREALLLQDRLHFSEHEAARLMGVTKARVVELRQQAYALLRSRLGADPELTLKLKRMPDHPLPVVSPVSTLAISQLIANVDRAKADRRWGLGGITAVVLVFSVLVLAYFLLKSLVGRSGGG